MEVSKAPRTRQSKKKTPDPALPVAGPGDPSPGDAPAPCPGHAACPRASTAQALCPSRPLGQAGVVEHLQDIVRQSVAEGNMQHALKAIELLGKHLGMFRERAADKDEAGPDIHVNLDLGGPAGEPATDEPHL